MGLHSPVASQRAPRPRSSQGCDRSRFTGRRTFQALLDSRVYRRALEGLDGPHWGVAGFHYVVDHPLSRIHSGRITHYDGPATLETDVFDVDSVLPSVKIEGDRSICSNPSIMSSGHQGMMPDHAGLMFLTLDLSCSGAPFSGRPINQRGSRVGDSRSIAGSMGKTQV